jgi:hypothetical protein
MPVGPVPYASGMDDRGISRQRKVVVGILSAIVIVAIVVVSHVYGEDDALTLGVARGIATTIGVGTLLWIRGQGHSPPT